MGFSPDGRQVAAVGSSGVFRLWDVARGERIASFEGRTNTGSFVLFTPDGRRLITGGETAIWDIATREALLTLPGALGAMVLSPDGRHLASLSEKGINIYTLEPAELLAIARSRVTRPLTDAECRQYLHRPVCAEG